jgi:hypothetical protein
MNLKVKKELFMDRIEKLRGYIDEVLLNNKNIMER